MDELYDDINKDDEEEVEEFNGLGDISAEDVNKSLENGMNYHLSKPFDKKQLNAILADIFVGRK